MKRLYILLALSTAVFMSCVDDDSSTNLEYEDLPVVQGFAYPNDSLDFKLSKLILFNEENSDSIISDVQIEFSVNDSVYPLIEQGDSGVYQLSEEVNWEVGDKLSFTFDYNGEVISSSTVIPTKPQNFSCSNSEYYITQITEDLGPGSFERPEPLELEWDNSSRDYYFIKVENIEDTPTRTNTRFEDAPEFYTVFDITQRAEENVNSFAFGYYGTHRIILYHVNEEYVGLFETEGDNSLNLTDPVTNIENGLGVFTAFSSDTIWIEVIQL